MNRKPKLERFEQKVLSRFQIYNSLFLTLPFKSIKNTSVLLPLFFDYCKRAYSDGLPPKAIVESFIEQYTPKLKKKEQFDLLFHFIQYIERQVVLFDAIEDAAYAHVNDMGGRGTLQQVKSEAENNQITEALIKHIENFKLRIVLTAHPTQFYPDNVLVIINELSKAIAKNDLDTIKTLLAQLGKTPFFKKEKPTPYDEAVSLIWYLENVFYHSAAQICNYLKKHIYKDKALDNPIFDFGFWPGGDRDGNPYVTPEITLKTAKRLQFSILRNYYRDLRKLKKKITFPGVEGRIHYLEETVFNSLFYPDKVKDFDYSFFLKELEEVLAHVQKEHQGLYADELQDLIHKLKLFGFHFASLDIRQDSRVHNAVFENIVSHPESQKHIQNLPDNYKQLNAQERCAVLPNFSGSIPPSLFEDEITRQTLESIYIMREIQGFNGERGCNRYIISNCQTLENILQLFAMHRICGWSEPTVDFIPLFETITDLKESEEVMRGLFSNSIYKAHLKKRGNKQTIMLGFSDGTKDGGYLMANWSIYKAKEALSVLGKEFNIRIAFFDGRGGPPARGGGNTHQFYASMGSEIQADDIQLTVQGQTISSNFGTLDSSQFNLEQLVSAGINNNVLRPGQNDFSKTDRQTMNGLAEISYKAYQDFKSHPKFIPYLELMSTLPYYAKTNIGSRPAKRGKSTALVFSDLRAIPFVGSWSLLKQNVPGFFGVGSALKAYKDKGAWEEVKSLYNNSRFFRTLLFNSMMSLTKSFFQLTQYMEKDKEFGAFWKLIYQEYELTHQLLLEVTGMSTLMENELAGKASIKAREEIVLPLLTIQQYALMSIQEMRDSGRSDAELKKTLEAIITRSLFGNINASRNSA